MAHVLQTMRKVDRLYAMRTVVITCVFPPEPVVSSQTSSQVAEGLRDRGYEVEVLAPFPSRPAGKPYQGYQRRLYKRETKINGVKVLRCISSFSRSSTLLSRFIENISFGISSALALLIMRRPDVLYVNTWPLFATGLIVTIARMRRIPTVLSIQDVYPEVLVAQSRLDPDGLPKKLLEWLDTLVVERVDEVAVISEEFRDIYRGRGVSDERLHVIPNWVDEKNVNIDSNGDVFRQKLGIPNDAFLAIYGGNVGAAAGTEILVRAFSRFKSNTNMYLCIAGEGSKLEECQRVAQQLGCDRVLFYSPWPVDETSEVLRAADLLMLPTAGHQSFASVPSKLITYMLAARPIIALAQQESSIAHSIHKAKAGWVIPPDDIDELVKVLVTASEMDINELVEKGKAGRTYALDTMTKASCLPGLLSIIEATGIRRTGVGL